jgi:hypothetical protein
MQISTVGFGDLVPQSASELGIVLLLLILFLPIFPWVVGEASTVLLKFNVRENEYRFNVDEGRRLLLHCGCSQQLEHRVTQCVCCAVPDCIRVTLCAGTTATAIWPACPTSTPPPSWMICQWRCASWRSRTLGRIRCVQVTATCASCYNYRNTQNHQVHANSFRLHEDPFYSHLDMLSTMHFAVNMKLVHFEPYSVLFRQDQGCLDFYLIIKGGPTFSFYRACLLSFPCIALCCFLYCVSSQPRMSTLRACPFAYAHPAHKLTMRRLHGLLPPRRAGRARHQEGRGPAVGGRGRRRAHVATGRCTARVSCSRQSLHFCVILRRYTAFSEGWVTAYRISKQFLDECSTRSFVQLQYVTLKAGSARAFRHALRISKPP